MPGAISPDNDAEIISVFVCSVITQKVLDAYPKLKCIVTRSTGMDHIDVAAAKERNVTVCNLPNYAAIFVAEFTFALMLALARKICIASAQTKNLIFSTKNLCGFDLCGKTLGIVGMGTIGKGVARRAKGFGMQVFAYDNKQDSAYAQELGFCYTSLEELLQQSDIITLHLPAIKNTYHFINKQNICLIKKGALLINTARGSILETQAVVWALQQDLLAGVGLDVLDFECQTRNISVAMHTEKSLDLCNTATCNCWLMQQENVLVTPHIAYNSIDALQRRIEQTVHCIQAFIDSRKK